MRTAPDFEWSFCGERYRIRFYPLTARFEGYVDGEWRKLGERHRPSTHVRFTTGGLRVIFREQLLSALDLQRTAERAGLAETTQRARNRKEAA